jgi:hypothetical protein
MCIQMQAPCGIGSSCIIVMKETGGMIVDGKKLCLNALEIMSPYA